MKEVEVKARVANLAQLEVKIGQLGVVFSEPIRQEDRVYALPSLDFTKYNKGMLIFRLRNQGKTQILTMKRSMTNELDSEECETEVEKPEAIARMLELLGYQLIVEVKKVRRKARYNAAEICLDQVDQLGNFIEVERLVSDDADSEEVQEESYRFLESLGVERTDRVTQGYDTQVKLKNSTEKVS